MKESPSKVKEKEGGKKECQITQTQNLFLYYAKHPFSIPQGGEDRSPHPPDHLSNDHEQGAERQQAARANGREQRRRSSVRGGWGVGGGGGPTWWMWMV